MGSGEGLDAHDIRAVEELAHGLRTLSLQPQPPLQPFLASLRALLPGAQLVAYGLRAEGEGYRVTSPAAAGWTPGSPEDLFARLDAGVRTRRRWSVFDPGRPEAPQRNRPLVIASARHQVELLLAEGARAGQLERLGIAPEEGESTAAQLAAWVDTVLAPLGVDVLAQLRVLVCDGASLLAWVGALRSEPFGAREQALLAALTPALQQRLTLEARLQEGPLHRAALDAVLEAMGLPAFLLDAAGQVRHTNGAGRAWLTPANAHALREAFLSCRRAPTAAPWLELSPVHAPGLPPHALAVVRSPSGGLEERLAAATRTWALTPRQREVLALLVQGEANKAISARLGTSERTVELHVTTLLRKVGVDGRSALAARFWTLPR